MIQFRPLSPILRRIVPFGRTDTVITLGRAHHRVDDAEDAAANDDIFALGQSIEVKALLVDETKASVSKCSGLKMRNKM